MQLQTLTSPPQYADEILKGCFHSQNAKCSPSTLRTRNLNTQQSPVKVFDLSLCLKNVHFLDGLLWTVGLSVQMKLRFQVSPAQCSRGLSVVVYQVAKVRHRLSDKIKISDIAQIALADRLAGAFHWNATNLLKTVFLPLD